MTTVKLRWVGPATVYVPELGDTLHPGAEVELSATSAERLLSRDGWVRASPPVVPTEARGNAVDVERRA